MRPGSPKAPLVSVIVPALNAQATLRETLASIASQTYRNIEIVIVDDGSTDDTARVAEQFCAKDGRARLIRQKNTGLAGARNKAVAAATGEFIAPLDADDLWHADKIRRQLERFAASSGDVALVYNWSRIINERSLVIEPSSRPFLEGQVLRNHLAWNFIGNGSTPLIRAGALRDWLYNAALRNSCEDYLLQLQIASRFEFACVPAFLTGYRRRTEAMSGDLLKMIMAHISMYRILFSQLPRDYYPTLERQLARQFAAQGIVELAGGQVARSAQAFYHALTTSPLAAAGEVLQRLRWRARSRAAGRYPLIGRHFNSLAPDVG